MEECERCGEVRVLCPLCLECTETCCSFDICKGCGGHTEGDENGIGYCIDCSACWCCGEQKPCPCEKQSGQQQECEPKKIKLG